MDAARGTAQILAVLCVAQFMVVLDVSIVNVAAPSIQTGLRLSDAGLAWVVNAYTLAFGGFLLLGGRAGDLLGRRRMFLAGAALFTSASLAGGLAQSEAALIGARALQGLGGAIVAPATLALLATTFEEGAPRSRALAVWGGVASAGGAVGGVFGGVLTELLSWRWVLFLNIPIGAALIWWGMQVIPHDPVRRLRRGSFDVAGAITCTLGVAAIVFAILRTGSSGWTSRPTLTVFALGGLLLLGFVVVEARAARFPLVPLRVFASRQLTGASSAMFLLGAVSFGLWYLLSLYLQEVLRLSPLEAGLAFVPQALAMVLGSMVAGMMVARIGAPIALAVGFGLSAAGFALLGGVEGGSYLREVLPASLALGFGIGVGVVTLTTAAISGITDDRAGLAAGVVNVARFVGGAVGLAVLTTLATGREGGAADAGPTQGYPAAFVLAAVLSVLGGVLSLALIRDAGAPRRSRWRSATSSVQQDAVLVYGTDGLTVIDRIRGGSGVAARAAAALARGECVIVHNGSVCVAAIGAAFVDADLVAFLAREARGLVCVAMAPERADGLGLHRVARTEGTRRAHFTVSVDAITPDVTTGISAADRAVTIEALRATRPEGRLGSPGHIFPIRAVEGGVLARSGITEACVDLACGVGLEPVVVFCDLLDADGEAMPPEGLAEQPAWRERVTVSVEQVVAYRRGAAGDRSGILRAMGLVASGPAFLTVLGANGSRPWFPAGAVMPLAQAPASVVIAMPPTADVRDLVSGQRIGLQRVGAAGAEPSGDGRTWDPAVPRLAGADAYLRCTVGSVVVHHDHVVIVADVEHAQVDPDAA